MSAPGQGQGSSNEQIISWPPDVPVQEGVGGGGSLYGEVQCIIRNGHMATHHMWIDKETDTTENINFPKLRLLWGNKHLKVVAVKASRW